MSRETFAEFEGPYTMQLHSTDLLCGEVYMRIVGLRDDPWSPFQRDSVKDPVRQKTECRRCCDWKLLIGREMLDVTYAVTLYNFSP